MKLVVGLGNPGREYASTRHNIGFMVLNELARRSSAEGTKKRFRSELKEGRLQGEKVVLIAPQTYMNLSGHAVREAINWYHVDIDDVMIVFDEMDLPFGQLRLRQSGTAGGHNGLKSIIEQLGTTEIPRLRIGIGRGKSAGRSHVLSRFSPDEEKALPGLISNVADAIEQWISEGITATMNGINRKVAVSVAPNSSQAPGKPDDGDQTDKPSLEQTP
jgi:PTH1 family peptidyl-tRNA hydrolase